MSAVCLHISSSTINFSISSLAGFSILIHFSSRSVTTTTSVLRVSSMLPITTCKITYWQISFQNDQLNLHSGTATVGVVGVRTPPKIQVGCPTSTPTILVYLVTCNWLLNYTTGVHFIVFRNSWHQHGGRERGWTPQIFKTWLHPWTCSHDIYRSSFTAAKTEGC